MPLTPLNLTLVFLLRAGQMLVVGAPGILAGAIVAGLIGPVVAACEEHNHTGRRARSVARLVGVRLLLLLVPLSSLGAILVADRLRRLGRPWPVALLVLLSGGLAPWMIPWGLARAEVATMGLAIAAATLVPLVVAIAAALVVGDGHDIAEASSACGSTRLRSVVLAAADSVRASALVPVAIGVVVAALFALTLPRGWLEDRLGERGPAAYALATGVGTPTIASPEQAMAFAWTALDTGSNPGTAVAWLALAGGAHAGTFVWLGRYAGWRRAAAVMAALLVVTLAISSALDPVLFRRLPDDADTHIFDALGRPWHLGDNTGSSPVATAWSLFARDAGSGWGILGSPAALSVAGLFVLLIIRSARRRNSDASKAVSPLSPRRLMLVAGGSAMAWGGVAAYSFFPPPREATAEIRQVSADIVPFIRQGKPMLAQARIERLKVMVDRRATGAWLRAAPAGRPAAVAVIAKLDAFEQRVTTLDPLAAAAEYAAIAPEVIER